MKFITKLMINTNVMELFIFFLPILVNKRVENYIFNEFDIIRIFNESYDNILRRD